MPRPKRTTAGDICYHVINRGNGRAVVFHKDGDYAAFVQLINEATERLPLRLLAFCLMPNHFHLVLRPYEDGDLSRWMQWLMTSHVRRYHRHYEGSGHVWQGRFKSFPIQEDDHLLTVVRYVETNPVRAGTLGISQPAKWPWSSAGVPLGKVERPKLHLKEIFPSAKERMPHHLDAETLKSIQLSLKRGRPFGDAEWQASISRQLGLESTLRPQGRPSKKKGSGYFSP